MSKFKRVSESEQLPGFMEKQFVGASTQEDDKYAHLREGATERRVKIAREQNAYNQDNTEPTYDFGGVSKQPAAQYNDQNARADEWGMLLSGRSIKRASYDTDEGENTRDLSGSLKAFSDSDYMSVMLRGATIFDPAMDAVEENLLMAAAEDNQLFDRRETRDIIAMRKSEWERNAKKNIREPQTVMSRACGILRTSTENETASRFGQPIDPMEIFEREEQRIAMAEDKRTQRLAIKREGKTLEEKASEWEQNAQLRPTNLRDVYSGGSLNLRDLEKIEIEVQ